MVPRPRAPKGLDRPAVVRARTVRPPAAAPLTDAAAGLAAPTVLVPAGNPVPQTHRGSEAAAAVALTRTPHGWVVVAPCGTTEPAGGLVEGLTLADLVIEELGGIPEPDRSARRSARGRSAGGDDGDVDPRDARIAALERTVSQLEHALAARVATERAIGLLCERYAVAPREAFDALRQEARTQSRPVQELAREVLEGTADPAAARLRATAEPRVADGRS